MFKAKQIQTLNVAEIMDRILENHGSKVSLDKLKTHLDSLVHENAVDLNDDAQIRKDAERGYSWNYERPLEQINISVKDLVAIIGYEVPVEDAQIYYECHEKYDQYYAESHKED